MTMTMRSIILSGILAASLALPALPTRADDIAVVGPKDDAGNGRTWFDFLIHAVPGITVEGDCLIGKTTFDLAFFDGEEAPLTAPLEVDRIAPASIRAANRQLVAILSDLHSTGESQTGIETSTMLSIHDVDGRLVDRVNVTLDRMNSWDSDTPVLHVSSATDLMAVHGRHFNSNQGYDNLALMFVDGNSIKLVDSVFVLSDRNCDYQREQQVKIEPEPPQDAQHGAFKVIVSDTLRLTQDDCEVDTPKEPFSRKIVVHYTWSPDVSNYVADPEGAKAMEALQADNESRL